MATRDLGPVVIQLQRSPTHIQWRPKGVTGDPWLDLIPLTDLIGHNIEMQKSGHEIQWRVKETPPDTWKLLFDLSDIRGAPGPQGDTGSAAVIQEITYSTHIVEVPSYINITSTGLPSARSLHFDFFLEDVSHAINNHNNDPNAHPSTVNMLRQEILNSAPTVEWTAGTLYLKKPNGQVTSFAGIAASNTNITGSWTCPTPSI